MTETTVRIPLTNGSQYPALLVHYRCDDDGHGWQGKATTWQDGSTPLCTHNISIRQGQPLGKIFITLDCVTYGAWAMGEFEGTGITSGICSGRLCGLRRPSSTGI